MPNRFPQDYSPKEAPVWDDLLILADSESLDENSNPRVDKKLKLSSLFSAIFWSRTTDDLEEWDQNQYYTETKVSNNETVTAKANKINVIEKDSTTPFTPTAPTHPVNKGYADSLGINIDGLNQELVIAPDDKLAFYDESAPGNRKLPFSSIASWVADVISNTFLHFWSRISNQSSWDQVIPHWLWRIPNLVNISYCEASSNSSINWSYNWYANGSVNYTIWVAGGNIDWRNDACLYYDASLRWWRATIALDATNITITWTKLGSGRILDFIIKAQ